MEDSDFFNLSRFLEAQSKDYSQALREIRAGRKESHWMWYVFPQFLGLGTSGTSRRYAIRSTTEAEAYLRHAVLGPRLEGAFSAVLEHARIRPIDIFGDLDTQKLHSSATLFSLVATSESIYEEVLVRFFTGVKDERTVDLLRKSLGG